jgi:hypothetical protein
MLGFGRPVAAPTDEERLCSLQRLLLRICVIVKEADGRVITNQAMLHQLYTIFSPTDRKLKRCA